MREPASQPACPMTMRDPDDDDDHSYSHTREVWGLMEERRRMEPIRGVMVQAAPVCLGDYHEPPLSLPPCFTTPFKLPSSSPAPLELHPMFRFTFDRPAS